MKLLATFFSLTLVTLISTAQADTLVESTNYTRNATLDFGQSFTTPDDGTADILTGFNWFNTTTPTGAGDVYLFTSAYAGTPAGLSSAGALAEATWDSATSVYDFSVDDITLQPDTTYYIYSDTSMSLSINATGGDVYSGGDAYQISGGNFNVLPGRDMAFQVTATSTPEPATAALGCIGAVAVFAMRKFSRSAV